jgi:hypothetical protein
VARLSKTPNAIAFQHGADRLIAIDKVAETFLIRNLQASRQPGTYKDPRRGQMQVQPTGEVIHWEVPGRSAVMFLRVGG